jgi:membrane protease YdiL (CAAX protease family)
MAKRSKKARSSSIAEYIVVLLAYLGIYAGMFYYQMQLETHPVKGPEVKEIQTLLVQSVGINLLIFIGIGALLMAIFNRMNLVTLTVHERSFMDSVAWVAVVTLFLIVLNKGIHSVFATAGAVQEQSPIMQALAGYFTSPLIVLTVGALVMFLAAGLPEEFMRCYVINNAIRLRSGALAFVAIALTSVAFGAGHYYQGVEAMVSIGAVGVVLGIVYYLRQSFWTQVFIHTTYNVVVLLLPLLTFHKIQP